MSKVASRELCKKLYDISSWDNDASNPHEIEQVWMRSYHLSMMGEGNDAWAKTPPEERKKVEVGDWYVRNDPRYLVYLPEVVFEWWWPKVKALEEGLVPAYDLGYLMRKLPIGYSVVTRFNDEWLASWAKATYEDDYAELGDTPEDALVKLCIRLFVEGILQNDNDQRT